MNGEGLEVNSPGDRDNSLGRKDELHGGKESTADSGMNVEVC